MNLSVTACLDTNLVFIIATPQFIFFSLMCWCVIIWSTEGVQRTDTHDDVDDGMVVDIGPSVTENRCCHLCHFPHLPHVLVINELVEFRDKFGSEKGSGAAAWFP